MWNPQGRALRGAIVGCGYFSQFHLEAWRRIPGVEMVAACDPDRQRAELTPHRAYAQPEDMLTRERLDFIDIATRPESHEHLVRLAAEHGVGVICQKPVAPSLPEAVALVAAAERAGVPLMIHDNWRWQPWYRAVKHLIETGSIGRPLAYWFRSRKRDGLGAEPYAAQPYFRTMPRLLIYETLVHHVDVGRFLCGEIASVYAQARRRHPLIAGEDQALILLRHTSAVDGTIDGHRFLDPDPDGPAMGEAGFEGDEGALLVLATGDVYRAGQCVWRNEVTAGYRGDSVRATQQHFIDCLRTGQPFETGGRAYLGTFAAAEAAYESIATQRAVVPAYL